MTSTLRPPTCCIACGGTPQNRWHVGETAIVQCPRCLLAWWDWESFDPTAFYDRAYFQSTSDTKGYDNYAALEDGVRRTASARLHRISAIMAQKTATPTPPKSLLEIGCGTGLFLDEARQQGWACTGNELSAYAVDQARARGLNVEQGSAECAPLPRGPFECVALWDVLEHLRAPQQVLQAAATRLRPGGILALSTGDVASLCARVSGPRWHLFNIPEHLFYFSIPALERLLSSANCRIVKITREVNWVPVAYVLERLRKGGGMLGHLADIFRHLPGARASQRTLLPAILFDVLGVYAVRR